MSKKELKKKAPEEQKVETKQPTELTTVRDIPQEVFIAMDKADEQMIVEELSGQLDYAKDLVYQANIGGRSVTALSYKGIKEAIHHTIRKGMQYEIKEGFPMRVDRPDEDSIMIMMVIRNPVTGEEFAGSAQCEKTDKFAMAKATSKAQRNALKSFIPEAIYAKVVEDFLQKKKARAFDVKPAQPTIHSTVQGTRPTQQPAEKTSEEGLF